MDGDETTGHGVGVQASRMIGYAGIAHESLWLWSAHHNLETFAAADVPLHEICEEGLVIEDGEGLRLMEKHMSEVALSPTARSGG